MTFLKLYIMAFQKINTRDLPYLAILFYTMITHQIPKNRPKSAFNPLDHVTFGVSYFVHRNLHQKTHLFCHMTLFFIDPENNPTHDKRPWTENGQFWLIMDRISRPFWEIRVQMSQKRFILKNQRSSYLIIFTDLG